MELEKEYDRVNRYIVDNIKQLPTSYVLDDYYQMLLVWEGLTMTPEMNNQLDEARQKSITADTIIKLNEVITIFNKNETTNSGDPNYKSSVERIILDSKMIIESNSGEVYELLIEHDLDSKSAYVALESKSPIENTYVIKNDLDFSPIWGVLNTDLWTELEDIFGGVFIGEEEFIQEFKYAFKLQSYKQFYNILEELNLFIPRNNVLPSGMKIIIGEHDNIDFEFFF